MSKDNCVLTKNSSREDILERAIAIREKLLGLGGLAEDIDQRLERIPSPFLPSGEVKLVIVGQDPTVRRVESRSRINTVLNLDDYAKEKRGSLTGYIGSICSELGVDLGRNLYATNLYKCFFRVPPSDDERVLVRHFEHWIGLLHEEVSQYPDAAVITLGRPLLRRLILEGPGEVSYYWDYIGLTKSGGQFRFVPRSQNQLGRAIFPFPHQPTYGRSRFYKKYFERYCAFVLRSHQT